MEDLFEILIVIAVAVFGIASRSKKNKKKSADKPAPARAAEPITEPAKPIAEASRAISRQNIENAVAAFSELLDAQEGLPSPEKIFRAPTAIEAELKKAASTKAKRKKRKTNSGESPVDEHGCIGGSMPVHQAEGESLAEHAKHEENRRQNLRENAPAVRVENLRPSNQELRRAIVMAEVLDKPVSLRGRRL